MRKGSSNKIRKRMSLGDTRVSDRSHSGRTRWKLRCKTTPGRCSGSTKENACRAACLLAGAHRSWHMTGGEQFAVTVERGAPLRGGIAILATVEQVLDVDQERKPFAAMPNRFSHLAQMQRQHISKDFCERPRGEDVPVASPALTAVSDTGVEQTTEYLCRTQTAVGFCPGTHALGVMQIGDVVVALHWHGLTLQTPAIMTYHAQSRYFQCLAAVCALLGYDRGSRRYRQSGILRGY